MPSASDAAQSGMLACSLRNPAGQAVSGNLFIRLVNIETGQVWRTFRYDGKTARHVMRSLPGGPYGVTIAAAGYEPAVGTAEVDGSETHLDVILQPKSHDRLILDVSGKRRAIREALTGLPADARLSANAKLLFAFLSDQKIDAAIQEAPRRHLHPDLTDWIGQQMRSFWNFHVSEALTTTLIAIATEHRLRMVELARAVFAHPEVMRLLPELEPAATDEHVLRFLSTLDSPDLDVLYPLLVQLYEPRRAVVERFLRNIQSEFELRPPAGAASAVIPESGGAPSGRPPLDGAAPEFPANAGSHHPNTPLRLAAIADGLTAAIYGAGS